MTGLKVLTLNCWGVPTAVACKLRQPRMEAIGNKLGEGEHDVVILEEVWSKADYRLLCEKMKGAYPYTHYFYSGAIGSGVCVFSKAPIVETFYSRFSLNGYAHKIHHGDWFGGKGVGMCKINFNGFRVCLFCTHLHASYNIESDEYLAHRVSQAFEMSHFIKLLGNKYNCDLVITAGDLNLQPTDLGYKILRANACLLDSWLEKNPSGESKSGMTCDIPSNSFTKPSKTKELPDGQRIDYILYRPMSGTKVTLKDCYVTMGNVPGEKFNYSDHEGVAAVFDLDKSSADDNEASCSSELGQLLQQALDVINTGMKKTSSDSFFYTIMAVMSVFLLYIVSSVDVPHCLGLMRGVLLVVLTLFFGFCIWHKAIITRIENHGLKAAQLDIKNVLQNISDKS